MAQGKLLFDRKTLRRNRDRSAGVFAAHDFLLREAALRLGERLEDVTRKFDNILTIGDGSGLLLPFLRRQQARKLVQADLSRQRLLRRQNDGQTSKILKIVSDEEALPFAAASFDLILCLWNLHWVNDLPGTLIQINRCLRTDGLFLAVMPGSETLHELRSSLLTVAAQQDELYARIPPFVELRDAGTLLQRAGFALPVADSEILKVSYKNMFSLLNDLRKMGEANILSKRRKNFTPRGFWQKVERVYQEHSADEGSADGAEAARGMINASFEFITLTGWHPHPSQQQPARRGSGKVNLKEVLTNDKRR